jgi:hypothetical protein
MIIQRRNFCIFCIKKNFCSKGKKKFEKCARVVSFNGLPVYHEENENVIVWISTRPPQAHEATPATVQLREKTLSEAKPHQPAAFSKWESQNPSRWRWRQCWRRQREGSLRGHLRPSPGPRSLLSPRCAVRYHPSLSLWLIPTFASDSRVWLIPTFDSDLHFGGYNGCRACAPSMLTNHLDLVSAYRIHTFTSDSHFGDTRGVGACAP